MPRYTEEDCTAALERLAAARGWIVADHSWSISDPRRDGAVFIDYNPTYGGASIRAYVAGSPRDDGSVTYTAETEITTRQSPRQFCESVWFALRTGYHGFTPDVTRDDDGTARVTLRPDRGFSLDGDEPGSYVIRESV